MKWAHRKQGLTGHKLHTGKGDLPRSRRESEIIAWGSQKWWINCSQRSNTELWMRSVGKTFQARKRRNWSRISLLILVRSLSHYYNISLLGIYTHLGHPQTTPRQTPNKPQTPCDCVSYIQKQTTPWVVKDWYLRTRLLWYTVEPTDQKE